MNPDHGWIVAAAFLAGSTLLAYVFVEMIWPAVRHYRLRHPCRVYFNIPGLRERKIEYLRQDDRTHHTKELTLPPNAEFEIEIIYTPKLIFHEDSIAFGCESPLDGKPYASERFDRFTIVGKSHWIPGKDDGHTLNRHKFFQIARGKTRNLKTHFIVGFKLKTEKVGVWPMKVFFITDEVEGSADLTIRVEERPTYSCRCFIKNHGECYVYPTSIPALRR